MTPWEPNELEECELRVLQAIWNLEEALKDIRQRLIKLEKRFVLLDKIKDNKR